MCLDSFAMEDALFATPRPNLGLLDARTTLRDFAMVSYDVDPVWLSSLLPSGYGLKPEVVTLADGRRRAFVSAVNFVDRDFRFQLAQVIRASFVQTNYRAYVRRHGERAVWFFGTTLASRLSILPRVLWGMPWHRVEANLHARWQGDRCIEYASSSRGRWGGAELRLVGTGDPISALDGFAAPDQAALVLTHPLTGFFAHRRGGVGRYSVWHERLRPTLGRAIEARFTVFEQLGLVGSAQEPHSVLLQPSTEFVVLLPPTRISRDA